eukprot:TRINITY_DN16513_c0_g1_i2.p3 TRINITY_DN16513_c0_g1~~TRINITY_DN16513_c0_g1_i2.p3  ORF type:complete len:184 (+),score=23.40 TRINITY_DN16513_c0_g1_i2:19-570(+)
MDETLREGVMDLQSTLEKAAKQGIRQAYELEQAYNQALKQKAMVIIMDWTWHQQKQIVQQNATLITWLQQKIFYWFLGFDATFLGMKGYNLLDISRWMATPEHLNSRMRFLKRIAPTYYKVQVEMRNQEFFNKLRVMKDRGVSVVGLSHMDGMKRLWEQEFGQNTVKDVTQEFQSTTEEQPPQ